MNKLFISIGLTGLLLSSSALAKDADNTNLDSPPTGVYITDPFANMMTAFFNNGTNTVSDKRFLPLRMTSTGYPKMDMYETKDNLVIQFEIPGIDKSKLNLEITDSYVSLKYEEKEAKLDKDKTYSINERAYGPFERVVSIPSYVDSKKAEAKYENGVLNITIPKSEDAKAKPKKIEIK